MRAVKDGEPWRRSNPINDVAVWRSHRSQTPDAQTPTSGVGRISENALEPQMGQRQTTCEQNHDKSHGHERTKIPYDERKLSSHGRGGSGEDVSPESRSGD